MKIKFYWQIIIALVLGVFTGALLPGAAQYISWAGGLFMNGLSMLIVPIIFFSISTSIADLCMQDNGSLGKLGIKTLGLYVVTMLIAIATGLLLVYFIHPGRGVEILPAASAVAPEITDQSVKDIVVGFVPSNIFYAFAKNYTMPVIFIAIITGCFVTKISPEGRSSIMSLLKGGYELTMLITKWVIRFAPLGVFAIVVTQFAAVKDVLALLGNMAMYVVTVTAGLVFHTFVTLPLIMRMGYGINPWKHLKNMSAPLLTAFSTASSGAALPLTLEAVTENDKVSARVANFVIPLGATINMNGAALLECVAVIFVAQVYGIELTFLQTLLVCITSLICAIGSAGIPMSAMVMMAIILNVVGLPVEGIGLVIGVDRILDMMRTTVNVYGDTCVAAMVARSEGESLSVDNRR